MRSENEPTSAGGWPQVRWDAIDSTPQQGSAQPMFPPVHEQAPPPAPEPVEEAEQEPDGYIYDAAGYAHPVYDGYVYDEAGNAYPVESLPHHEPPTQDAQYEQQYDQHGQHNQHAQYGQHAEHDQHAQYDQHGQHPQQAQYDQHEQYDQHAQYEQQYEQQYEAQPEEQPHAPHYADPIPAWDFGGDEPESRGAARRGRSNGRGGRTAVALLVSLALVVGAGYAVVKFALPMFKGGPSVAAAATDYPGPGTGSVEIVVAPGDTGGAIGATLEAAGVVASANAFRSAYAANPDAVGIQHGTYTMLLEMSAAGALERLMDTRNKVELRVTIVEGSTVEQILKTAASRSQIPLEDFEAAAEDPRKLGVPEDAEDQLEGWLFPATYTVVPGDTAEDLLSAMVKKTQSELSRLGVPEGDWETVLNKASLVEREINRDEDRGKAARVIENRLEKGMTLGIDATLAYGLKKSGFALTRTELRTDHPYNTRMRQGLPPTPIGSPGVKAIEAVLNPTEGNWEYWVTVNPDTGETIFSETWQEHEEHSKLFDQWLAENS